MHCTIWHKHPFCNNNKETFNTSFRRESTQSIYLNLTYNDKKLKARWFRFTQGTSAWLASKSTMRFAWCFLYTLAVCLCENTATAPSEIKRGKQDSFSSLECTKSSLCGEKYCQKFGADCVAKECKRCQCRKHKGTFFKSDSTSGNCTEDENIIPASGKNELYKSAMV